MSKLIKNDIKVTMLIATLFGMVKHHETTRKVDKVRKQLRKWINAMPVDDRIELIKRTNDDWEKVKALQVHGSKVAVSLSLMLVSLFDLLENSVVSEKNYMAACASLEHGFTATGDIEKDTAELTIMFREALGIPERKSLGNLRLHIKIQEQNKILEGR